MADQEARVQMLHKSATNLQSWLDNCQKTLANVPSDYGSYDLPKLKSLATEYKDLLLQMKERHAFLQEIKDIQKQLQDEFNNSPKTPQHIEMTRHIRDLSKRWQTVLRSVKQQHLQLSSALAAAATRALSPSAPLSPVSSFASSRGSSSTRSSPSVSDSVPSSPLPLGQGSSKDKHSMLKSKSLGTCSSDSLDDLVESLKQEANIIKQRLTSPPSDHQVNGWREVTPPSQRGNVDLKEEPLFLPFKQPPSCHIPKSTPRSSSRTAALSPPLALSPPPQSHPPPPPPRPHANSSATRLKQEKKAVNQLKELLQSGEKQSLLLQTSSLESHIAHLQATLTQLNQKSQELSEIALKSSSSNRKPVPDYQNAPFRLEDIPLSKEQVVPLKQQVEMLTGKAQNDIRQFQSVQVMVHNFETQAKSCHESLSVCEERVRELKECGLNKETGQQPIHQCLSCLQELQRKLTGLSDLSTQLHSMGPQFDGSPLKQELTVVKSVMQRLQSDIASVAKGNNDSVFTDVPSRKKMFKEHPRSSSSFGFTSIPQSKPPVSGSRSKPPLRRTSSSGSNPVSHSSKSPSPHPTDFQHSPRILYHSSTSPSPPPSSSPQRRAIKKPAPLPKTANKQPAQEKDEEQTDSHTPAHSLCKGLMQYIRREYTDMADFLEIPLPSLSDELQQLVDGIAPGEGHTTLKSLAVSLTDIQTSLDAAGELLGGIEVPADPDPNLIQQRLKQCKALQNQLDSVRTLLEQHSEHSTDNVSLVSPSGDGKKIPSTRLFLLLEYNLFDLSSHHQCCRHLLTNIFRALTEREKEVKGLHQVMGLLSQCLEEAKTLLARKQRVLDVGQYLSDCKDMHTKLTKFSAQRQQAATKIRSILLVSTHHTPGASTAAAKNSHISAQLLEQLQSIETQWVNTVNELASMPRLESILVKQSLRNIAVEVKEVTSQSEQEVTELDLDAVQRLCKHCELSSEKAHQLKASLLLANKRLLKLQSMASGSEEEEENDIEHSHGIMTLFSRTNGQASPTKTGSQPSHQQSSTPGSSVGMIGYESLVRFPQLVELCQTLLKKLEESLSKLETLQSDLDKRRQLLEAFRNEADNLQSWLNGAKDQKKGTLDTEALAEEATDHKQSLLSLHELSNEMLALPANQQDKEAIQATVSQLTADWEVMCQRFPGNVQVSLLPPVQDTNHLKPPDEFDDISEMVEWLILIESNLQPQPLRVPDTEQVKGILKEILLVEEQMQSKADEFHHFLRRGARGGDPQPGMDGMPLLSPSKCVKFIDENTIERKLRRNVIKQNMVLDTIVSGSEGEESGDELLSSGSVTLSPSHSAIKPPAAIRRKHRPPPIPTPLTTTVTAAPPSLFSPVGEESRQLSLLWNGVWTLLNQQKQKLESVLDIWSGFESKREAFEEFLSRAEADCRTVSMFSQLSKAANIEEIHRELLDLKTFGDEILYQQQKLGTLNDLTSDLIHHHRASNNTESLQQQMTKLNQRWKKVQENYHKHSSTLDNLYSVWEDFYSQYQTMIEWVEETNRDVSSISPQLEDPLMVKGQVMRLKEVVREMVGRSGTLDVLKLKVITLSQGKGSTVINTAMANQELAQLRKRWEALSKDTQKRLTTLEAACSERQDVISIMSRCEDWMKRMEDRTTSLKPTTADIGKIRHLIEEHKEFETELKEKQTQLSLAMARARHLTNDFTSALVGGVENSILKLRFTQRQVRLEELSRECEEIGKNQEIVLAAMEQFQHHSSEFSHHLSELENRVSSSSSEQVGTTQTVLNQQLDQWQQMEGTIGGLGKLLETMVTSQKKLMDIGTQVSQDVVQLVRRYHKQWSDIRKIISSRLTEIKAQLDKTALKPRNENGVKDLPAGWSKTKTNSGTPFYVQEGADGSRTQWQHPQLSQLYRSLVNRFQYSSFPSPAYLVALRLRCVQKTIQFDMLPTQIAEESFREFGCYNNPKKTMSFPEMTEITAAMFRKAATTITTDPASGRGGKTLGVTKAVELATSWIQDVFDLTHVGMISTQSFQAGIISLSHSKIEEKHKVMFNLMSRGQEQCDLESMMSFIEILTQVPQSMSSTQYCSLATIESHVRQCFGRHAASGKLDVAGYLTWAMGEPLPVAWLPVLHRLSVAENTEHNVTCTVCNTNPIAGFRYKCLQCLNLNMCQQCYWSGKTARGHDRNTHFMEEYCIPHEDKTTFLQSMTPSKPGRQRRPHLSDPPSRALGTQQQYRRQISEGPRSGYITESPPKNSWVPSFSPTEYHSLSLSHVSRRTTSESIKESSDNRSSLTNFPMLNDASQDKQQQTLAQYNHLGVSNRHTPPPPPLPPRPVLRNLASTSPVHSFTHSTRPTPPDRFNDGIVHQRTTTPPAFSSTASSQLTSRNMAVREKANRLASGNRELEDCISQLQSISTMGSPAPN